MAEDTSSSNGNINVFHPLPHGLFYTANIYKIITFVIIVIKWESMTIQGLFDKVKALDLRKEVPVIIERTKADVILLNQLQLYAKGKDSLGNENAPYRSSTYAKKKESMNPQPGYGTPDLKLTGEFYRDFKLTVKSKTFEVDSVNQKSAKLKSIYGDHIFGLSKDSKTEYSTGVLFDGVRKYITSKTGLRFR